MAPQASKKCGLLPPDYKRIGSCMCNGTNSYQVPGIFSILWHIFHAQIDSATTYEAPFNARKPQVQRCEYDARIGLRGSRSSRLYVLCLGGTQCSFFLSSSDTEAINTVR
jgi:hypothetical protein